MKDNRLLDGRAVRERILDEVAERVRRATATHTIGRLVSVTIGDNKAATVYERGQARAQPERAADPRGQIALEVVDPLTRVHPAALARHRTGDVEGIGGGRVPEGHHGLGEGGARLPHLHDGALRRKAGDLGSGRGTREHEQNEERREKEEGALRRVIAHGIGSLHEAQPRRNQFGPPGNRFTVLYARDICG